MRYHRRLYFETLGYGEKVRVQESIDHLLLYLRYSGHWFRTAAKFESESEKQEAIQAVEQALELYESL